METSKNQNPEKDKQDLKDEFLKKFVDGLMAKGKTGQPKPAEKEQSKAGELSGVENPQKYTSGDLWTYGGIGSLITGIIGYFIGQAQGEKKARRECEKQMEEWKEEMEARLKERQLSGRKEKKEKTRPVLRIG